jgi:hypothetical protein
MRVAILLLFGFLISPAQGGNASERTAVPASILSQAPIEWALAQIESGHLKNPDIARGASGEVSRFQIMPVVWKSYSNSRSYSNPAIAWSVASRILKDRHDWFVRGTGRQPAAFDLYVMWNKPGLYQNVAFDRKRLPRQLREVASRFENLVHSDYSVHLTLQKAVKSERQLAGVN